jgi:hypothetical protein
MAGDDSFQVAGCVTFEDISNRGSVVIMRPRCGTTQKIAEQFAANVCNRRIVFKTASGISQQFFIMWYIGATAQPLYATHMATPIYKQMIPMCPSGTVTELVEIPLKDDFPRFLEIFQLELLPVLLAATGVLSVRTGTWLSSPPLTPLSLLPGTKTSSSDRMSHAWAVSLTEWDCLGSHTRFVENPSSAPFFAKLGELTRGPPVIDHFAFSSLRGLESSMDLQILFSDDKPAAEGQGVISARSLDRNGLVCTLQVGSGNASTKMPESERRHYNVHWYSYECKAMPRL